MKEVKVYLDLKEDEQISAVLDVDSLVIISADSMEELEKSMREYYKNFLNEDNVTFDYVFDRPKDKFYFHDE